MRQKIGRAVQACTATGRYSLTKVLGVPIDNDGGKQVEASHAIVLALGRAVADFALASDAQSVFQGMVRLALVQPNLGATLHIGVKQPVDDEQRPLNAADLAERHGQLMLTGIGRELFEQLTGRHGTCRHGGHRAQDARPVLDDEAFADLATDQTAQFVRRGGGVEEM